ncbi:MAG: glycosyltransferase [Gemmatimonadetes bacterium]|nr:glycosyltransferase [Gemmatimonadota bacterium]
MSRAIPIRVLLACDRLGYDNARLHGAGRLMIQWTRALAEYGADVTSVILRKPGTLGEQVLEEGLPFVFLSRHPYDPRTLGDFIRIIRERNIQVLHLQAFGASTFGRIAARRMGIPSIVHVHADYRGEPKGYPPHVRFADALLSRLTDKVLAISGPVADFAVGSQGFPRAKVEVLHNPVDIREFQPPTETDVAAARKALDLESGTQVAACVARFHEIKGVDVLVEAWAEVARTHPPATLLLLGDGPQRPALEDRAGALGIKERIRFLGYRDNVLEGLWASDIVVVPSRMEGLSLAALEAMATGLPVVATRVGGLPEIVEDGTNGFLAAPEDPSDLARAIGQALDAVRSDGAPLREAARSVAHAHDLSTFIHQLDGLYRSLVDAPVQA